ncbi:hypothetical protein ABZ702_18195, partial [Streptomyces cyaneofuscatus]
MSGPSPSGRRRDRVGHEVQQLAHDRLQEGTDGEPLLLVMGLAVSRHWWPGELCAACADAGFAVARCDQRDAGESTRLPKPAARGTPTAAAIRDARRV